MLLGHGLGTEAYDHARRNIGIALNLSPALPGDRQPADAEAAHGMRRLHEPLVPRPALRPRLSRRHARPLGGAVGPLDFVHDGDVDTIAAPTEYLGINYYAPRVIEARPGDTPWPWRVIVPDEWPTTAGFTGGVASTEAGTPIAPHGLTDLLTRVHRDYGPPVMVTENGGVFPEPLHDERRVEFLRGHIGALRDAQAQGVDLLGYMHWSLMDNFEWKLGYAQRFGLVHVDYATQERTIKDSGRAYKGLMY